MPGSAACSVLCDEMDGLINYNNVLERGNQALFKTDLSCSESLRRIYFFTHTIVTFYMLVFLKDYLTHNIYLHIGYYLYLTHINFI